MNARTTHYSSVSHMRRCRPAPSHMGKCETKSAVSSSSSGLSMVLNRSMMFAAALAASLLPLKPVRAEVGECNNQPGQCSYQPPAARRAPPPAAQPAPPPPAARVAPQPQFRPAPPPPQPIARAPQPQQRAYPTARAPQEAVRRSGGEYRSEYRGGYGRDRDRRYTGPAIAAGAVIIGSIIAYSTYRGPNRDAVYARCDRNFPDFDYDTGTFVNEDGDRETCPYLD